MIALGTMTASAQPRSAPDVSALLMRVGERVQEYYARALSVICLESVSLRQLGTDLTSDGSPVRRLVFELRIGWQPPASGSGPPEASVLRQIVTIDGRPPRPKDKPGCMDPKSVSPEPLAMLLPINSATTRSGGPAPLVSTDAPWRCSTTGRATGSGRGQVARGLREHRVAGAVAGPRVGRSGDRRSAQDWTRAWRAHSSFVCRTEQRRRAARRRW